MSFVESLWVALQTCPVVSYMKKCFFKVQPVLAYFLYSADMAFLYSYDISSGYLDFTSKQKFVHKIGASEGLSRNPFCSLNKKRTATV